MADPISIWWLYLMATSSAMVPGIIIGSAIKDYFKDPNEKKKFNYLDFQMALNHNNWDSDDENRPCIYIIPDKAKNKKKTADENTMNINTDNPRARNYPRTRSQTRSVNSDSDSD